MKTDANGEIVWDNLELGYYVLSETGPIAGMDPVAESIITVPSSISTDGSTFKSVAYTHLRAHET